VEWKRVEEGLPGTPNKLVLFVWDSCNKIGYGTYEYKMRNMHNFYDRMTDENVIASHWMDIPPLPECDEMD